MHKLGFSEINIFLLILILLNSCASRKPLEQIQPKKNSAIVAGKLFVFYNGKDVTPHTDILFNEILWGKYSYRTDSSHILLTELPLGEGHISRLKYKNFIINVPKEKSWFLLQDNTRINYLGHITIDWKGSESKFPNMFGLVGAIADEAKPDGILDIYVESKINEIQGYVESKFGSEHQILSNQIEALPLDSTAIQNLKKSADELSIYSDFKLKDGTLLQGRLICKKNEKLYVRKKRTMFIFGIEKLESIQENGQVVTEQALNQVEEKDIDLFNYVVKEIK